MGKGHEVRMKVCNNGFRLAVEFCGFHDLGMKGHQFTWEKGGEGSSDLEMK